MNRWLVGLGLGVGGVVIVAAAPQGELAAINIDDSDAQRRQGAELMVNNCMTCHSLQYVKYRDLRMLGLSDKAIEALAYGRDLGDPMSRYADRQTLKNAYGMIPPDLSLMAKAREGGARHIYTLLTEYYRSDSGKLDNHFFPGTAMPDVLGASLSGEGRLDTAARAKEATAFLAWAADPKADKRRRLGYWVLAYLVVLTGLLYAIKRRVWAHVDKAKPPEPDTGKD